MQMVKHDSDVDSDLVANLLRSRLKSRKVRNRAYSMRALARDIGLSPSHLCEVLNGRHRMSPKTAQQIYALLKQSNLE